MKGKKKTRAADIKRRLIDDERDPSPFAGIRLVEKKEPEKKAKTAAVPVKPRKPSEIVQGYDPSSSFADILYSFEHTGNPYSMPAPKGRRIEEKKTDFGAILDQWEGKGRKKARPVSGETRKSVYNPTRSFGDILDSFEGRKPARKESESAESREEMPLPDEGGGLFRKMDEDDSVSPSVSWTIFGGRNESFTRQEPEAEIKEEGKPEESPAVRRSPEYSPSRSFSEILSEFEGNRNNAEKKKEDTKIPVSGPKPSVPVPEDTLFRKPEDGESRAEGVSWSIFGGRNESFTRPEPESMDEKQDLPPSSGERAHAPAYKGQKPFSTILNDYEKHDGEKTFEEYIKEKGEADERKRSVFPISRLRTMPPQATLDLHGNTVKEAEDEVSRFLHECSENGLRKISIITGKGLHSEDGVGVLRQTVIRILDESGLVSERASAPLSAGGSGALWIILKA